MDFCCGGGGTDRFTGGRVSGKPIRGEKGWVEGFKRSHEPYRRREKMFLKQFCIMFWTQCKKSHQAEMGSKWVLIREVGSSQIP